MKRIFLLTAFVLLSVTAKAQYADGEPLFLERRGGNLYTVTDVALDKISARNILTEDAYEQYCTGRDLFNAGIIISATGGGLFAIGTAAMIAGMTVPGNGSCTPPGLSVFFAGFCSVMAGGALAVISIPVYCVGISKLNKAMRGIQKPGGLAFAPEISIGPQPCGIGFGIRF